MSRADLADVLSRALSVFEVQKDDNGETIREGNAELYAELQAAVSDLRRLAPVHTAIVNEVAGLLDGREWSSETCNEIADALRAAGYTIRDVEA